MDASIDQPGMVQENANYNFSQIFLGHHDTARVEPLTDLQYGYVLNLGVSIVPWLTQLCMSKALRSSPLLPPR